MRAKKKARSSSSRGAVLAEYGLLLALIFFICVGLVATIGTEVAALFVVN